MARTTATPGAIMVRMVGRGELTGMGLLHPEERERIARVQQQLRARGLDTLLLHSDEAEFANVRYLSDYWPVLESAGMVVPSEGEPILLIGPESEKYAAARSKIPTIRQLIVYRESAEPEYPDLPVSTFK